MEQVETITLISTGVGLITTMAAGFRTFAKVISKGIANLISQMSKDHAEMIKPIVEEVRGLEMVNRRVNSLEENQNELREQIEELNKCMRNVNERTDQIYTLLLSQNQNAKR